MNGSACVDLILVGRRARQILGTLVLIQNGGIRRDTSLKLGLLIADRMI